MDTPHRYFRLAHSSDTLISVYRKDFDELVQAEKLYEDGEGLYGFLIGLLFVTSIVGGLRLLALSDSLPSLTTKVGGVLVALGLLGGVLLGNARYRAYRRLAERVKGLPCREILNIFAPLEDDFVAMAEVTAHCKNYEACQAYVDAVRAMNRKLYQFDANYVAELAAVLKRGDAPQTSTWPGKISAA